MARHRGIWRRGQNGHWSNTLHGKQVHVADKTKSDDMTYSNNAMIMGTPRPTRTAARKSVSSAHSLYNGTT
jgi:hypothetical protein